MGVDFLRVQFFIADTDHDHALTHVPGLSHTGFQAKPSSKTAT
jgi:hypothetical protein